MKNSPELTTEEVKGFLIQPLTAASVVLQNGPVFYDSPTGTPLKIPKLVDDEDEPGYYGENEQIGESDPSFDEFTLLPENLKSLKVLHRFSNELARHAVVSIASTMQQALVRRVASKMDGEFLVGGAGTLDTNGNRGVIGLWNQPDTMTGDWDMSDSDAVIDSVVDATGKFISEEVTDLTKVVWFMPTSDFITLSKVKAADGRGLLVPDVTQPGNFTLHGLKVSPTSKLEGKGQMLVNFAFVAVGRDLAPSVKILDQTYGDYDQLAIRVVTRQDIGILHEQAVLKLS
jgi:HK97 family phage major capsid protein